MSECKHPPGSGHQKKIWIKALELKKEGTPQKFALKTLYDDWSGYHKDIRPAIERAVERVYSYNLRSREKRTPWPKGDRKLIETIVHENSYSLAELNKSSPYPSEKLEKIPSGALLQLLFERESLICMGQTKYNPSIRTVKEFCSSNEIGEYIVPRTMLGECNLNDQGEVSARCNNNTGPERYVVIEFDHSSSSEQLSIIKHLKDFLPLVLVIHSGNKSFHSWFNGCNAPAERVQRFRQYAAALGADTALFTKCQLVRTPNQTREENGKKQVLHYFDHTKIPKDGEGVSIFDDYRMPPEVLPQESSNDLDLEHDLSIKVPKIEALSDFMLNCKPEPPEMIEGIMHQGTKIALGGASKAGKSHLAMQMGYAVSKGEHFLGMSTRRSNVLYLGLELPDFSLKGRFEKIISKMPTDKLDSGPESLFISNGRGNWSGIQSLETMIYHCIKNKIELIIIDPLYKLDDIDENDQKTTKSILRKFDDIIEQTGASILYVHHFTKGKTNDKNNIDLLAGSSVLARDFDSCILLKESENEYKLDFILRNQKPKDTLWLKEDYPLKVVNIERMKSGGSLGNRNKDIPKKKNSRLMI
jgi:hypothetical protein